eukprot:1528434-Pyramimonas_sp.AAC.1
MSRGPRDGRGYVAQFGPLEADPQLGQPPVLGELPEVCSCGSAEHPSVPDYDHVGGGPRDFDVHSVGVVHEAPVVPK